VVYPMIIFGLNILMLVYFIYVLLYIITINVDISVIGIPSTSTNAKYMSLYHLFGFFWGSAWLGGINMTVISGAFATYYWTFDKRALPPLIVTKSLGRTLLYHLGSIALGSLLLSCVQFLRFLVFVFKRPQPNPEMHLLLRGMLSQLRRRAREMAQ
jgi:hypothetical protein